MGTDFEDVGGNLSLVFGETAGGVRIPMRIDASGQIALDPTGTIGLVADSEVKRTARVGAAAHSHEPAADTAAVITLAAVAGQKHVVAGVFWSYDDDPTAGSLTILDVAAQVFKVDITKGGPGFLPFDPPIESAIVNSVMTITLAAGGGAVNGIVNGRAWTEA